MRHDVAVDQPDARVRHAHAPCAPAVGRGGRRPADLPAVAVVCVRGVGAGTWTFVSRPVASGSLAVCAARGVRVQIRGVAQRGRKAVEPRLIGCRVVGARACAQIIVVPAVRVERVDREAGLGPIPAAVIVRPDDLEDLALLRGEGERLGVPAVVRHRGVVVWDRGLPVLVDVDEVRGGDGRGGPGEAVLRPLEGAVEDLGEGDADGAGHFRGGGEAVGGEGLERVFGPGVDLLGERDGGVAGEGGGRFGVGIGQESVGGKAGGLAGFKLEPLSAGRFGISFQEEGEALAGTGLDVVGVPGFRVVSVCFDYGKGGLALNAHADERVGSTTNDANTVGLARRHVVDIRYARNIRAAS